MVFYSPVVGVNVSFDESQLAFVGFRPCRSLSTPGDVMYIGVMDGYCGCCWLGMKSVSLVNTDLNCLFRGSAFPFGSLTNIPSTFRGQTPLKGPLAARLY